MFIEHHRGCPRCRLTLPQHAPVLIITNTTILVATSWTFCLYLFDPKSFSDLSHVNVFFILILHSKPFKIVHSWPFALNWPGIEFFLACRIVEMWLAILWYEVVPAPLTYITLLHLTEYSIHWARGLACNIVTQSTIYPVAADIIISSYQCQVLLKSILVSMENVHVVAKPRHAFETCCTMGKK